MYSRQKRVAGASTTTCCHSFRPSARKRPTRRHGPSELSAHSNLARAGPKESTTPRIDRPSSGRSSPRSKTSHLSCLRHAEQDIVAACESEQSAASVTGCAAHDMASIRCPPGTSQYVCSLPSTARSGPYPSSECDELTTLGRTTRASEQRRRMAAPRVRRRRSAGHESRIDILSWICFF